MIDPVGEAIVEKSQEKKKEPTLEPNNSVHSIGPMTRQNDTVYTIILTGRQADSLNA